VAVEERANTGKGDGECFARDEDLVVRDDEDIQVGEGKKRMEEAS